MEKKFKADEKGKFMEKIKIKLLRGALQSLHELRKLCLEEIDYALKKLQLEYKNFVHNFNKLTIRTVYSRCFFDKYVDNDEALKGDIKSNKRRNSDREKQSDK